jgi:hypothetical protein
MAARQQHRYDILATNMLFTACLLGFAVDFLTQQGMFNFQSNILSRQFYFTVIGISMLLTLAHYYYIRQGYRWAKILYLIFFGVYVVFTILDFKGISAKHFVSPIKIISFAVGWLLQLAACSLLLIGYRSTQWHRERALATPEL